MKNILRFIPLQLTFFLVVGILFQFYFTINGTLFLPIAIGILLVLLILQFIHNKGFEPNLHFNFTVYTLFFFIGIYTLYIHNDINRKDHYSYFLSDDSQLTLVVHKELKPGNYYNRFETNVITINGENAQGKILLNVQKDSLITLLTDDKIYVSTQLKELISPLNPYYFNYKEYLEKKNIHHQAFVAFDELLKLRNKTVSLYGFAAQLRAKINVKLIENGFKGNELAVINALLLGQRQDISPELLQSYTGAGAIHILAVSGLHVGIILLFLNFLFKPIEGFQSGKTIKVILIILLLWAFAFVAGLSASVVRAVAMFTAVMVGLESKRPTNVYRALIISIFFLLLFNPYYLFDVGFQLSYLAVFSIVWIQPMIYTLWKPKWKPVDYFWKLLTVSIAAQFGIIPISLYYFHQFPGLFFVSNLLIIPVLGLILIIGITVIILSLMNILPELIAWIYNYTIKAMNYTIDLIADQEQFLIQNISFSIYLVIASYLVIVFGIRFLNQKNFKRLIALGAAIMLFQVVFIVEKRNRLQTDEFVIFHKSRQTILGLRTGREMNVFHTLDSLSLITDKVLNQYGIGVGNLDFKMNKNIPNVLEFDSKKILIVDSLGIYKVSQMNPDIVILQQSPKINLNRVLDSIQPQIIIADGSNYKSYINRWQLTCEQKNTPFHYTGQKGAYVFKAKE